MGIREGLLVLLANGPKYGYQLKVDFEAATGDAWPLNVGQVYTTLQRLERDELATVDATDDEGRVSYRLTDAGRREFIRWMTTPERRPVPARDEVAMKVLLAASSGGVDPGIVIDEQRQATMANLQEYTHLRANTDGGELAWLLQLDRLIHLRQAELRWLDDAEERLSAAPAKGSDRADPTTNTSPRAVDSTTPSQKGSQS